MLKLSFATLIICLSVFSATSQTTEQKVQNFLGAQRYTELQNNNSALLDYLAVKVEEGYQVNQAVEVKKDSYIQIEKVYFKKTEISINQFIQDLNSEGFNILNYSFPNEDARKTIHYLLGDTNVLLTVFSNAVINNKVANAN